MMMSVNSLLSYSGAGSCGMRSSWPRSRSRLEYVLRQAAVTRLSGGHAPPERISSRHASLSGLDKIRVLWRKATTHPPRPLRKAAVPTAWGPECCLGGTPPPERISSRHASLSGLDKIRVLWRKATTHPPRPLRKAAVPTAWGPECCLGGTPPPERISSRHASLSGLDKIRVLWRKATTHPPRPLRKAAVPTAWGPECCLGGTPPRNESRQGTLRSPALTRFGCCGVRPQHTPPAAEESGRPHCVGPRVLSGGHAPPEGISSRHASLSGLDKIRVLWRKATTRPPTAAGESGRPHCVGPRVLSGGRAPPERISSRHASLFGLDKIRVLRRKATTRPPRPLRKAAVPTAWGPECYLGGTPPRNESRQGTLRSPALTRFGVLWR